MVKEERVKGNKMSKVFSNDILVRAAKTWMQAFLATLAVAVVSVNDWPTARAAIVGAVAAAISATWNTIITK